MQHRAQGTRMPAEGSEQRSSVRPASRARNPGYNLWDNMSFFLPNYYILGRQGVAAISALRSFSLEKNQQ